MRSAIFALGLLLVLVNACSRPEPVERPPNFVILFCDDMGYGDMGNTGHPTIRTPNLDRMAMEGMRFTNFYSGSPACTASRYALLTGKYPVRSGFSWVLYPASERGIHPEEVTIAEALKERGYATACFGKWHLGSTQEAYLPLQNGFDEYMGLPYSNDMIPPKWPEIPLLSGNDTLQLNPDQSQLTQRYTEKAIDFMEEHTEEPFLIYLPYAMPHVPLHPGNQFAGNSQRGPYGDVIEEIDWSVGRIREKLQELGLAENTLVIFTSDNGPWIIKNERGGSAGLLRDGKGSTWEGGMHVPGLAVWPGTIPAGRVSTEMASTLDLFPTLLRLSDAPVGYRVDGEDISGRFQATPEENPHRPFFYYGLNNRLFAVRKGPWKLHIDRHSQTGKRYFAFEGPILFNLDADPSEQYELSREYPDTVRYLLDLIEGHQEKLAGEPSFFDR